MRRISIIAAMVLSLITAAHVYAASGILLGAPFVAINITPAGLPSAITLTRGSSATYYNSAGVLTTAATNAARLDYDPAALTFKGLLIEPAAANVVFPSNNFASTWSAGSGITLVQNFGVAPDGTTTTQKVTMTQAFNGYVNFSNTLTAGVQYTCSLYYRYTSGAFAMQFGESNDGVSINLATNSATGYGTGVASVQSINNSFFRVSVVLTSSSNQVPVLFNNSGSSGIAELYGVQCLGTPNTALAQSYVATTSGAVTRSADVATFSVPAGINFITFKFDDASTQVVAASSMCASLTCTIPTNLNRPWVLSITGTYTLPGPIDPPGSILAAGSQNIVNMLGVNTHFANNPSIYITALSTISAQMQALGIKHARDGLTTIPGSLTAMAAICTKGIDFNFIIGPQVYPTMSAALAAAQATYTAVPCVRAWEGMNEPDNQGGNYYMGAGWPQGAVAFQNDLYSNFHGNAMVGSLPIVISALGGGGTWGQWCAVTTPEPATCPTNVADIFNAHTYSGATYPASGLAGNVLSLQPARGALTLWGTEMGWHTDTNAAAGGNFAGVDQNSQAKYYSMSPFDYWGNGFLVMQGYEMVDEGCDATNSQNNFGLLACDGATAKPAFTTLQNIIALLKDAGSYTTQFVPVTFSPAVTSANSQGCGLRAGAGVSYCVLGKSDGSVWIALWQEISVYNTSTNLPITNATVAETITLAGFSTVTVYQPFLSGAPVSGPSAYAGSVTVNVPDNLLLVKLN